jgi:two-component sensor histidine kinase/CheY-like chemotaxis protein
VRAFASANRPISLWLGLLSALSLFPLVLFGSWLVFANAAEHRATLLARIQQTTRALIHAVDERFERRIALLQGLATSTALREGRIHEFRSRAEEAIKGLPAGAHIIVADGTGQQLLNTLVPAASPLEQRSKAVPVKRIFEKGTPQISDVHIVATSNLLGVSVDVPVTGMDGNVLFDLSLIIPSREFTDILRGQSFPPTWFAAVLDTKGILAGRVPDADLFVGKPAARILREGAQNSMEGSAETPTLENIKVLTTWSRSAVTGWSVAVAVPTSEVFAPVRGQLLALLGAGLLALAVSAALAYAFAVPIARSLAALASRADAIGTSQSASVPPSAIKELAQVAQAMERADTKIGEQEQRLRLLIAELDHRVKNMLASVQAIATRTFGSMPQAAVFSGRLSALGNVHSQLSKSQGQGTLLRPLIEGTLIGQLDIFDRVQAAGQEIVLNPKAAQAIGLALHELTTNSMKYGALSVDGGSIRIQWKLTEDEPSRFMFAWKEHDGPPVSKPSRQGFGSMLIERVLAAELNGSAKLHFAPDGVAFILDAPLDKVMGTAVATTAVASEEEPIITLRPGNRVLVVEDETLAAMEVCDLLRHVGMEVRWVSTVDKGLSAADEDFQAAVLDVNVAGQMVFPVARKLAAKNTPYVCLTGYDHAAVLPNDLRSSRRLTKPVNPTQLYKVFGIAITDAARS